jgi:peptidyl-prolyl cis-trans isomerase B (cyclophilin B)
MSINDARKPHARLALLLVALALFAFSLSACSDKAENQNTANSNTTSPKPAANNSNATMANSNGATANSNQKAANSNSAATAQNAHTATIETSEGKIKVELLDKDAPKTAENFRKLAESGFYNGLIFHRVVSGFMIQGGDPNGNGSGGKTWDGQPLPNEVNRSSPLYQNGYHRGDVAMANKRTPESGSSQFFIMHQDRSLMSLPANYTIFARVVEGINVVDKIASAPVDGERPVRPVKMVKVTVP